MGKKINALLGRTFKTSKSKPFKPAVSLAISRLSVLKNQRQARMSVARSDVIELLNLGHHERALVRVEQVIKEQNMLDVFVMVEGYCHLLIERLNLVENEKGCPEELEEAVSSLIYASTRCGEFPELQEMREMFTSRFGKEFVARALELRNHCRVNTKVVVKLSTRQPNLESRMKVLKEIASENGISLQNEEESSITTEKNSDDESKRNRFKLEDNFPILPEDKEKVEGFAESMKGRKKYKDVADAAQAAFESAAYAAAAARAAVELSRSEPHDPDDQNTPRSYSKKVSNTRDPRIRNGQALDGEGSEMFKTHHSVYDGEMQMENNDGGSKQKKNARESKKSLSGSSPNNSDNIVKETAFSTNTEVQPTALQRVVYDGSDDEGGTKQRDISLTRIHDLEYEGNHGLLAKRASSNNSNTVNDTDTSDGSDTEPTVFQKKYPLISQASSEWEMGPANPKIKYAERSKAERSLQLNLENSPTSVRTR